MLSESKLNVFPKDAIEALALLYVEKNSSATSPKELTQEYLQALKEIDEAFLELDPQKKWLF